jgi:hypothetical protein
MTSPGGVPVQCRFVLYAPAEVPDVFPVPAVVLRSSEHNGHPGLAVDMVMIGVEDWVRDLPEGNLTLLVFGLEGARVVNDVPPGDWSWPDGV